jgi:hypothetical protein
MTRTSLADVSSLQDPAVSWNFDLFLPTIPGSSDTRDLSIKCMTTDMPGSTIERVEVPLHGVNLVYGGRKTYSHSIATTFLETSDWATREKFRRWHQMRDWVNNSGMLASAYKVNAQVVVYNDIPAVTKTCAVTGLWPDVINEVALDGSASNLITLAITFAFDFWEDI